MKPRTLEPTALTPVREVGICTLGAANEANGREGTQRTEMAMKAMGQARLERQWQVHA